MSKKRFITPDNCPLVRVGVLVKVRVSFRFGGQPNNCPGEKLTPGWVRVWVWVSFGVRGTIVLEPLGS